MTEPTFLTEEGFLRIKTMHRLRTVLQREGEEYLRKLHARCGVGLTNDQFDDIVKMLEAFHWCSLKEGALGATLVVLNPDYNKTHTFQPDEVFADACKPVAQ